MKKHILIILLFSLLFIIIFAHKPVIPDEEHTYIENSLFIEDHNLSQVIYHEFKENSERLWVKFFVSESEDIHIILTVPFIKRLENFNPIMIIVGPGLNELFEGNYYQNKIEMGFNIPEEYGVIQLASKEREREFFHEPFSNTDSWFIIEHDLVNVNEGEYFIGVFTEPGKPVEGKVGLTIGTKEEFSFSDLLKMGSWIQFIREFHELE